MQDRIIATYLNAFVEEFGLRALEESRAFEQFVTYCVVSRHHPHPFEPDETACGGNGDLGLDGIAILVDDHLVHSTADVDHFKTALRRLDVDFVLVQAKTSAHFETADIGTFVAGVRQFFTDTLPPSTSPQIMDLHAIKEYIFNESIHMDNSPTCRLYYATTGTWSNDRHVQSRIDQALSDLRKTNLFSLVEFLPIDAEGLKRLHREQHHKITREIEFERRTVLPTIVGVEEAFIGIVPCLEYQKLISDSDGSLNRRLFYDNVRDFQGHNPVNREIAATVKDRERNDRFALLNNGVTVVARSANKVGSAIKLMDFQVVNGCQTSHILHINREHIGPNVFLPFKLIVTTDQEVMNQIIQGTNRQTEVKLEAFESLAPYQKKLEEFYLAVGREARPPLYYERRSKQYEHLEVRRERIISLATQIKCFVGMFLNEPHSTHRYYGELLESYRGRLFSEAHSPMPYYTSGAALAALEGLFAQGLLPRHWKGRKHQMLMVFRVQNEEGDMPFLNSRGIDKYCEVLLNVIADGIRCEAAFRRAGDLVEAVRESVAPGREPPERTRVFTKALLERAGRGEADAAHSSRLEGVVSHFSDIRGWGFIRADDGTSYFVHYSGIAGRGYRTLSDGDRVEFSVVETAKGLQAVDVESKWAL